MYRDRKLARDNVLKVRLSDYEAELLEALANFTGQQKSSIARDYLMAGVRHAVHGGLAPAALEGAESGPLGARKRHN